MSVSLYIKKNYSLLVKEFVNKSQDALYFAILTKIGSAMITKEKRGLKSRIKGSAS